MSAEQSNRDQVKNRHPSPIISKESSTDSPKDSTAPTAILCNTCGKNCDPILFFCHHIIFGGPRQLKLFVVFAIIIIGSLLKTLEWAPESYFSVKTNIFNRYFAKFCWGWTLILLIPFVYLTLIKTHTHFQIITCHFVRLLVATGVWYIVTLLFVKFELYTGECKHKEMRGVSRKVCVSSGYKWQMGHDFSGHTFLLLYAILIINEEVKYYNIGTKRVNQASKSENASCDTIPDINDQHFKRISKIIRILYILLAVITILWIFMLLSTALYFHHALEKIVGASVAVFFWYMTYYKWYRPESNSILFPSSPKN